jgi:hypothetical protein
MRSIVYSRFGIYGRGCTKLYQFHHYTDHAGFSNLAPNSWINSTNWGQGTTYTHPSTGYHVKLTCGSLQVQMFARGSEWNVTCRKPPCSHSRCPTIISQEHYITMEMAARAYKVCLLSNASLMTPFCVSMQPVFVELARDWRKQYKVCTRDTWQPVDRVTVADSKSALLTIDVRAPSHIRLCRRSIAIHVSSNCQSDNSVRQ